MQRRRRVKHQFPLQERIIAWTKEVRKQAAELPPGRDRDALLKKVQQAEAAMHLASSTEIAAGKRGLIGALIL